MNSTDVADKIAAEAFAPQFLRSKLTEDEQIELHAHLQEICGRHIAAIVAELVTMQDHVNHADAYQKTAMTNLARAEAAEARLVEAERDCDCRAISNLAGTVGATFVPHKERSESAEKEASALRSQLERAREALGPFAAYIRARDAVDGDIPDTAKVIAYATDFRGSVVAVTFGDFRAARRTVQEGK